MKKLLLVLFTLLVAGCLPHMRVVVDPTVIRLPSAELGAEQLHAAACGDTPPAIFGAPTLPAPRVGPVPATPARRFGAGFPASIPLTSLQQGGASSTNVLAWNGSNWAPSVGGGSPTGTGVALVSGGSFVGAAGTVDLSSSTYVANQLGLANGGLGASLGSCAPGTLLQIASGPVAACNTSSGDITYAAGGAGTVGGLGSGRWSIPNTGAAALHAIYNSATAQITVSGPTSDLATANLSIIGMPAYASAATNVTGGGINIIGGQPATNGNAGSVNVGTYAPTGSGAEGAFIVDRIISGTPTPYGGIGAYSALPSSFAGLTLGPSRYPNDGMPANVFGKSDGSTIIAGASYIEFNIGASGLGTTLMYADNTGLVAEKNLALGTDPGVYNGGVGVFSLRKAGTNPSGTTTTGIIYADSTTGNLVSYPTGATGPILDVGASSVGVAGKLGGLSTTPLDLATTTGVACSSGTTVTISSAQAVTPRLVVTASAALTVACVLDFGTNATSGFFAIDYSGAASNLSTGGIQVKNGSYTSPALTASLNTTLGAGGLAFASLRGSNTGAVNW